MAPALAATGLLVFIAAWNEFLFALTFTITSETRTVPVAIALISGATGYELPWGNVMAASVTVTLPLVLLVLIFQRRIVAPAVLTLADSADSLDPCVRACPTLVRARMSQRMTLCLR